MLVWEIYPYGMTTRCAGGWLPNMGCLPLGIEHGGLVAVEPILHRIVPALLIETVRLLRGTDNSSAGWVGMRGSGMEWGADEKKDGNEPGWEEEGMAMRGWGWNGKGGSSGGTHVQQVLISF